jgi:hypothetical protein
VAQLLRKHGGFAGSEASVNFAAARKQQLGALRDQSQQRRSHGAATTPLPTPSRFCTSDIGYLSSNEDNLFPRFEFYGLS